MNRQCARRSSPQLARKCLLAVVAEHYEDGVLLRLDCEVCEDSGRVLYWRWVASVRLHSIQALLMCRLTQIAGRQEQKEEERQAGFLGLI